MIDRLSENPAPVPVALKAASFARYARALAQARGSEVGAEQICARWRDPGAVSIARSAIAAATSSDSTWAGPLAPSNPATLAFAEAVRAQTILGKLAGTRRVPFQTPIVRITAGANAAWVAEGEPTPVTRATFDTLDALQLTRIGAIIAQSDELLRTELPGADDTLRRDLVGAWPRRSTCGLSTGRRTARAPARRRSPSA